MRGFPLILCVATLLSFAAAARAEDRYGVGFKVGTLGLGVELTGQVNHWFALRASLNQYNYSHSFDKEDIHYDGDLKLGGYGVLADVYPVRGRFRLTAGLLSNRNKVDLTANPTSSVTIGDTVYTPQEVGTLTGEMRFRSTVPYFGLGFGNAARGPRRVGFVFDLGVVPQGSANVTLSSDTGAVSSSDLQKEASKVSHDSKGLETWPVVALGVSVRI